MSKHLRNSYLAKSDILVNFLIWYSKDLHSCVKEYFPPAVIEFLEYSQLSLAAGINLDFWPILWRNEGLQIWIGCELCSWAVVCQIESVTTLTTAENFLIFKIFITITSLKRQSTNLLHVDPRQCRAWIRSVCKRLNEWKIEAWK